MPGSVMALHNALDILRALSSGVVILDSAGSVQMANAELQRILGASPGEIRLRDGDLYGQMGALLGFPAEAQAELQAAITALFAGKLSRVHLEVEVTNVDPGRAYILNGALLTGAGAPSVLLEVRDVTETWAQRQAHEHELALLQALVDAIPSPLFYKNKDGVYLGCNRALEAFLNVPRERIVGHTAHEVMPRDQSKIFHESDLRLMRERSVERYETQRRHADGTRHDVMLHVAAVTLKDQSLAGMVGIMFDISERKRLEEELRQQNRDLSTPILELTEDIIAMPLIGAIDAERAVLIMERLLDAVAKGRYPFVILDVTGVERIDEATAQHLLRINRTVELIGAKCYLSGIRPSVAKALVGYGVDMAAVPAYRDLKQALFAGLQRLARGREKD